MNVMSQITFLYFEDLKRAADFFEGKLEFERACDQGHCLIWRTSQSSFVAAVDIKKGSVEGSCKESVLTCFVVEDVEHSYSVLQDSGLKMLTDIRKNQDRGVHSFLFAGPEGYRFEVQEFKGEEERERFGGGSVACGHVGAVSQITFMYFKSLVSVRDFFDNRLKLEGAYDQGYCKMWQTSRTSFIGAVDESILSFDVGQRDGVLTSFVVDDCQASHRHLKLLNLDRLTDPKFNSRSGVKSCMFYGPEGYRFEAEEFTDVALRKYFAGN